MSWLKKNGEAQWWVALAFIALLAAWLRCHLFAQQVFADDEWHGFYYALGKSPGWLLTHFSIPGATCIPLNFYAWMLGQTTGWSECLLRLPSLACGMICVMAGPLLAQKFIGRPRAALLGVLLAISPILIFYSRIYRPYSAVAMFGLVALLLAAHWMQTGRLTWGWWLAVAGVLAIYFHLFAAVTIATPLLVALVFRFCGRYGPPGVKAPASRFLWQWLLVAGTIALLGALLVLPALVHSVQTTFFNVVLQGTFSWDALPKVAQLISGTGTLVLMVLFWLAVILGAVEQCRKNPFLGWTLVALFPLHLVALLLSKPDCAQSGIVLVRYCIPLVPACLLLAACGMVSFLEMVAKKTALAPALQVGLLAAALAALFATGPFLQCCWPPNNFTNHGVFQHRYGPVDWRESFRSDLAPADFRIDTVVPAEAVSSFYRLPAAEPNGRLIVEYPMMIGDHFNPLYFYQHFHHRPVLAGYAADTVLPQGLADGNIFGNTYIDQVLSRVADRARLKFRNFVDMDDLLAMRRRNVEYIVLHKRYEAQLPAVSPPLPDLERLEKLYRGEIGAPVYEDANVVAFKL